MNFSKNMVLHPSRQCLVFPGSIAVTAVWGEPCREAGVWGRGWVLPQRPCTLPRAVNVAQGCFYLEIEALQSCLSSSELWSFKSKPLALAGLLCFCKSSRLCKECHSSVSNQSFCFVRVSNLQL